MKIIVCVKQILDPELPPSAFEIDKERKRAKIGKHAQVIDPYSANALELALQIKEKKGDVKVTAITFGDSKAEDALRKSLGVLVDEAVHVLYEKDAVPDSYATAKVLATAIQNLKKYDLILCGRQAGDWDAGMVGSLIGEYLSIPSVCFASKIHLHEDGIKIERYVEGGTQILSSGFPVLVTVTNDESNVIRIAKVKDVMRAHRKPIRKLDLDQLEISLQSISNKTAYADMQDLFIPEQEVHCEIIEGEDSQEKVDKLLSALKEKKLL